MGMTVNSFTSVSLDPPLVLWSPAKSSSKHDAFAAVDHYAIHVLSAEQDGLSACFTRGGTAFEGLEWQLNTEGAPVIPGTLSRFECRRFALHDAGDHSLIIGRVLQLAPEDVAFLISADLFCCGIVSILQSLGATPWFGVRMPVMM